jgi:hypothetical protein
LALAELLSQIRDRREGICMRPLLERPGPDFDRLVAVAEQAIKQFDISLRAIRSV